MSVNLPAIRIGQGFDVHAFAPGRELILGGVKVPHDQGLLGHSDADVLLHAVTDAVLGALSWGDIGQWFPDSQAHYKGISSSVLLGEVWQKATAAGWSLINCDIVLLAQQPKLAPYIAQIRSSVALLLGAEEAQVGVKATTTEHLGFVGRSEGIAAAAIVLLHRAAP